MTHLTDFTHLSLSYLALPYLTLPYLTNITLPTLATLLALMSSVWNQRDPSLVRGRYLVDSVKMRIHTTMNSD